MKNITGQCYCGAISFSAVVDPSKVVACHCTDCQIFSGAPLRAVVPTPIEQVHMVGSPKEFIKVAESGRKRVQAFCEVCGTHIYATEPDAPKMLNLRLGSINEKKDLVPAVHIWGSSSMPWIYSMAETETHEKGMDSPLMPPRQV